MRVTQRFSFKITVQLLLVCSVAFTSLALVINSLFSNQLNAEAMMVAEQKLDLVSAQLDNSVSEVIDLYYNLMHDTELQTLMVEYNALHESNPKDIALRFDTEAEYHDALRDRLFKLKSFYANVRYLVMISSDGQVLDPVYYVEPYASTMLEQAQYETFLNSPLLGRFSTINTFPYITELAIYDNMLNISYLGSYLDDKDYTPLGTIAIHYQRNALSTAMEPTFSEGFDYAFVTDEQGQVILRSKQSPSEIPEEILQGTPGTLVEVEDVHYSVLSTTIASYPSWKVWGITNYEAVISPAQRIVSISIAITIVTLLLVLLLGNRISLYLTRPLRELGDAVRLTSQGNWSTLPQPKVMDEIGTLISGYNTMVDSLHRMNQQVQAEQEEKHRIEMAMVQSRMDLLQSQINPHFIHNTLNAMNYMAQKDGAIELSRLIVSFNGLLRTSMSIENMFNSMAQEIENLRRYIVIQRARYDEPFTCTYDVPDEALLATIPKLILQPLIENALFHGIIPKGGGTIIVRATVMEGRLWVSVVDDGEGISPERMAELLSGEPVRSSSYSSVGLQNVCDRLVLTYGPTAQPVLESIVGRGTSIYFSIPVKPPPQMEDPGKTSLI